MKRISQLFLTMLLALPMWVQADNNLTKFLPNDHDGWQNLTYGVADSTDWGSCGQKMEIVISGKYIHLAWMEEEQQNDGMYPLYYRRSSDYGKTWEAAKLIATNINSWSESQGYNCHWMWASGKDVRFAIPSFGGGNMSKMRYIYSTDYGSSFTTKEIAEGNLGWARYARPHIACDGSYVIIAANYDGKPIVFTSTDGGATFTEKKIDETYDIADLQVSGKRWTLFGSRNSGDAYDRWARVFFSTSKDGGKTVSTENLAHVAANGKTYSRASYLTGWNRATFDYHQQMVQQGETIDLVYVGSLSDGKEGDPDPGYDYNHTIHRRSTDGGKTWSEAKYLPESSGGENVIAAKGDNIYIYSGWNGTKHVFYSHDGGKTWNVNELATKTNNQWNPYNDYNLVIAPDDATGKHAYLTGERGYFVETRDGFKTINRIFALPSEQWYGYGDHNNWGMRVLVDNEGTEHWFMHFSPLYKGFEKYFWSIVHRRNDPVANTTNQNMALSIEDHPDEYGNSRPYHLVTVPLTPSLQELKKAITVECWVRIDSIQGFQIAALTDKSYNGQGSNYEGGWYMGVDLSYSGGDFVTLVTGMTTELSVDAVGTSYWDRDRYRMHKDGLGMWHHIAFTYDSSVEKDNFRTYADGMLLGTKTLKGDIMQGHNSITIGKTQSWVGDFAQVDNFTIWDHALSADELRDHLYNAPTGKENGCRLLLTFDGSLQDQSPYHNDAIALTNLSLKAHNGIRAPHPEFTATKDVTGKIINLTDMTQDGNACWWILPDKWNLGDPDKYSTKTGGTTVQHDVRNSGSRSFNGLYKYYMVAKGTGNYNAYAATSQQVMVGGLNRVYPEVAGQSEGVALYIEGGYTLTYSNSSKLKVVLKQGATEIEGTWDVYRGYDSGKITSPDDMVPALFNLSTAALGKYDVIVGTDTLYQAFTLEKGEEPNVWMQVNGRGASLWNKWQRYTIDYGNTSNTAAYNTPIIIIIPDRHGTVDVSFDFDFYLCDPALDDKAQEWARQMGDHIKVYDELTKDSVRVYSFMIPYIAPNSTNQRSFRIKMAPGNNEPSNEIKIAYWIEQPWGPNDSYDATTRAPFTLEQGECFAKEWASAVFDTAISFIPGASCISSIAKAGYSTATGAEGKWSTLFLNAADVFFNCGSEVIPGSSLVKGLYNFGSKAWDLYSKYKSLKSMRDCLKGDPNEIGNKGRGSYDPNEMIGPWGPDDNAHYIQPIHQMGYTVTFENKASATAPAHEVFVTDTLDATKYDLSTFSFTSYGWADVAFVAGGSKTQEFTRDVQYKVNGQDILVRVSGQFDQQTGIARWAFVSLDKNGNEIDDPDLGFLVPNNANLDGEGFVSFIVEHKKNPANGSTISNKATIVFDANDPITTNTYVNTFDTDYPTSKITKAEEKDGQIVVTIDGNDKTSGIDHYTLYAFINDSDSAIVVASNIVGSQVSFVCEPGTKYGLCVIATDRVGLNEPKDLKVEKTVTTGGSAPSSTYALNVAAAGYATFYDSQSAYSLPAGLKASVVSSISGGRLSYQTISGDIVPKATAVLIEASQKKAATYTLTSTTGGTAVGTNLLHGSDNTTTTTAAGDNLYYKLAYGPSGTSQANSFGWFWGAQNGAAFQIEGHRAWLAIPKGSGARGYFIDGNETAVEDVTVNLYDSPFTDLQGRRIDKPTQPGIYLQNGKKIVVK